jgi:tetratricopeptide (TPR) repeat protein
MVPLRNLVLAACLVATLPGATNAAATTAERAKARDIFRAAQQHYKLAEYDQALEGFKEAYRVIEDPSLLFNIAQCYRQLNKKEEAIRFYRTYLHEVPDSPNRDSVQQIIASLESALKQESAARAAPPESTIEQPAGGAPTGATPTPALTATSSPPPEKPPVYKRWWLWTGVAAVVVVGLGVGLGVGLSQTPAAPSASTTDGTFHPF